jgi:hypothetical protein
LGLFPDRRSFAMNSKTQTPTTLNERIGDNAPSHGCKP